MTSDAVSDFARQARSALAQIQCTPGLTEGDKTAGQRLVAEADRLDGVFREQEEVPAAARAWMVGLRSLMAQGNEIRRKYELQRSPE